MLLKAIKAWLERRLDVHISGLTDLYLLDSNDGTLIARILESYQIISHDEVQLICESVNPEVTFENFTGYVRNWLRIIGIELSDSEILEITHREGTTNLTLFYEIYLALEDTDQKYYAEKTWKKKPNHVFAVTKVAENLMDEALMSTNPLCEPILKQWDVLHWERDHLASLMVKCHQKREEYQSFCQRRSALEIDFNNELYEENEDLVVHGHGDPYKYSYEELIAQQLKAINGQPFQPDYKEAKRILKKIKKKHKNDAEHNALKIQLQQDLLNQIYRDQQMEEDKEFDKTVANMLLKQSQYEKDLADKLFKIRQQKAVIVENRKKADEEERKKHDEEFIRRLMEEELEEKMKYHEEQQELLKLHKELYEEKMKTKQMKHEKICRDVVKDITDLALKTIEYKKLYGFDPPESLRREWAILFKNQQQILEPIPKLESQDVQVEDEISVTEFQRNEAIDEEEFQDYINFRKKWQIPGLEETFVSVSLSLGLNVIGYVVHRLLLTKYPLPLPEKPNLSPEIEISVCTNNIVFDTSKLGYLQRLLDLKSVKVIQIQDAVNFCLDAYEKERKTEYDEPFPEEDLKEIEPRRKADKKKKGGKKDKKDKKKSSKGSKKDKKGKKGKKSDNESVPPPVIVTEEKQAQTPRLFPWEKVVLTNKARLGKIAKAESETGHEIEDKYLAEMVVEYLMSFETIKGWVLINYPNSYEQAACLEQALTGKPVPKEYFDAIINRESLESVKLSDVETIAEEEQEICDNNVCEREELNENLSEIIKNEPKTCELENNISEDSADDSEFIVAEEINLAQERIMRLLPDLIPLVYSAGDNKVREEQKKETTKSNICTCICLDKRIEKEPEPIVDDDFLLHSDTRKRDSECACYTYVADHGDAAENDRLAETQEKEIKTEDYIENSEVQVEDKLTDMPLLELENQVCQTDELVQEGTTVEDVAVVDKSSEHQHKERVVEDDKFEERRISKIVPNPRPFEKELYNTILTAFIKMLEKEDDDDIENPYLKNIERIDGLEKFYCDQGCYYLLQYEEFNCDTVKCLAKMIIGDYSLPLKSSLEIFGERYLQAKFEVGDNVITKKGKQEKKKKGGKGKNKRDKSVPSVAKGKKGKKDKKSKSSKSSKGSKKGKKGKKGKPAKEPAKPPPTYEDKEVQFPMVEEEEEGPPEPRPGEPDYEYVDFGIPPDIMLSLAEFWDNLEQNYVREYKELMWRRRLIRYQIGPYLAQVKRKMDIFIVREDQKQYYLREFQKTLNEIDLELRSDQETKQEIICSIDEFKEKLLSICDDKMRESEDERRRYIKENWLFHQLFEFVNESSFAFQLEIDRFVDSMKLINDYYSSMILKEIKQLSNIPKETLEKLEDIGQEDIAKFNGIFIDFTEEFGETAFCSYVIELLTICLKFIDLMKDEVWKPLTAMKKIFEIKPKEKKPKKSKKSKKNEKIFEPEEDVKENSNKIFEEWECAIEGEFSRVTVCFNLIKETIEVSLRELTLWIQGILKDIYDSITERYNNELDSVKKAVDILQKSVEEEVIIQPELTFDGAKLAELKIQIFPQVVESLDNFQDGSFKLEHLDFMVDVLLNLAPSGFIMEKTFLLLIQDMLYEDDIEEKSQVPRLWRNLPTKTLQKVFQNLFDDNDYVHWKDFIICNLMVPFPTSEQLMDVRRQFRELDTGASELATRDQFATVRFWFEESESVQTLKSIIFKLYKTSPKDFNYTAMLLDFCRDDDPLVGFAKALELSLGRLICYRQDLGEEYVENVLTERRVYEQKLKEMEEDHEQTVQTAKRAVSFLIDSIVHQVESATLTELPKSQDDFIQQTPAAATVSLEVAPVVSQVSRNASGTFITESRYSDIEIFGESRERTHLVHFLPLDLIMTVLVAALPWCLKVESPSDEELEEALIQEESFQEKIERLFGECRNDDFNGAVLAHEFLNSAAVREVFKSTRKFSAKNPVKIVRNVVENFDPFVIEIEEDLENYSHTIDERESSFLL